MANGIAQVVPDTANSGVRKWRQVLLGISDHGDPDVKIPTTVDEVFDLTSHLPLALPAGVRDMGYITTDGVTAAKDIKADDTQMLQSIEPVRTDVTSMTATMAANFGESNAWTNAMIHGLPVSAWPEVKKSAFAMSDGGRTDLPYYVLWMLAQDGVGENAVYRFEVALKAKVTNFENRKLNAGDPELFGATFGLFKDDIIGRSLLRVEESPSFAAHLQTGQSLTA